MLVVMALLAAACGPWWLLGSFLSFVALGPHVEVHWPAASEIDAEVDGVSYYRITVDSVEVAQVPAAQNECLLTGLAADTLYNIEVTAMDLAGDASIPNGGPTVTGTLSDFYLTSAGAGGGASMDCVSTFDTDGDRLPDALETNTGTYVDAGNTGTDPLNADTDGDSIEDGDEVFGSVAGLDLPAFGVSPLRQDLLLEYDWFDDNVDPGTCAAHSHQPTAAMDANVAAMFAASPNVNPDGSTGINMINDYGQGGVFTGGNLIADADGVIAGGVSGAEFAAYKAANFAANRNGYFHYTLLPHRYNTNSASSGQAEILGDDLIVSLYCFGSTGNVSKTIAHELGHNLNLRHGGNVNTNNKPNYNSLMNYDYQFPGVDTNCTPPGDGVLDYSHGTNASLNEASLLETDGICGGVDWDWNTNSVIDAAAVAVDINADTFQTTLTDWDDWSNLSFMGLLDGDGASLEPTEVITEQPVPESAQIVAD